ncbi:terminase large subunit domain-containing protein [Streptomyces sp. sk2.1]|uniref:terminase large subunit domain-containing protein n=1 Tax=Streptomyces sp. sk2.1 TaxID=2478959 RepID=UPI00292A4392|nr:terminase family protein [Streptomyces sp. sk2.1]
MFPEGPAGDLGALLAGPQYLAAHLLPGWTMRAHTQVIGEAFRHAVYTPGSKTAIITPPQVGKSALCAQWGPFWALMGKPDIKIVTASYGQSLAERNGRAIRSLVDEHGHRYGRVLARGERSVTRWSLTHGGGVFSAGVGAALTGFSADMLIIDDLYKSRADAESLTIRDTIWDWLSSSALTRMSPGAPILMIGTLWTEQDAILRLLEREGRLEDGGEWRVVHLPAIADHALTGPDPLGRADGDYLTHPKIPERDQNALRSFWETRRASTLLLDWQALYQGDPRPRDGAVLTWEAVENAMFNLPQLPAGVGRTVVAVDPAGGGQDEVGIIVASVDPGTGIAYITHDYSDRMSVTEWPLRVCAVAEEHRADRIVLETNFGAGLVPQAIRSAWAAEERSTFRPAISAVRALKGKILRAEPIAVEVTLGRLRFERNLTKLAKEWASYVPGTRTSPGRLDASVYAAMALLRPAVAHLVRETAEDAPAAPPRRRVPGRGAAAAPAAGRRRIPGK